MKYCQEYTFQRTPSEHPSTAFYNNRINKDDKAYETRIRALEQRIDCLEKKLKHYEETISIKNFALSNIDIDEDTIREAFQRISQLEELYSKVTTASNSFLLQPHQIEKVINDKVNIKIGDLSLRIQEMKEYNERQQIRFANLQENVMHIDQYLTENSGMIKELGNQIVAIQDVINCNNIGNDNIVDGDAEDERNDEGNENEEELFLKNISG